MFRREAEIIGKWAAAQDTAALSPLLNIGSGSSDFRERERPWIDRELFAPLRARGVKLVHSDISPEPGVDICANLLNAEDFAPLDAVGARTILLNNVLEHVPEAARLANRCYDLLPPGGHLLISVPRSYPRHGIDTMFRPTPAEIAALVPQAEVAWLLDAPMEYHWHEIAREPRRIMARKLYWLFTPYRMSFALLRKPNA